MSTIALTASPVRFHDLRHTFATMNLIAGEHHMRVAKFSGTACLY
ncbi:hypothetical protein [Mycolicibacterium nivoides]|uniref:Tyr recombinase domain-containing protein n=1 Tax=Mycolicibacterium nivoides TaxID=2487344 RepID=A0ABW9L843_9MYCO